MAVSQLALLLVLSVALGFAQPPAEGSLGRMPLPAVVGMSGAAVKIAVSPRTGMAPREITVTATITPHPDNRVLVLILDGPKYLRQDIALNTVEHDDQRTFQRRFKDWPAGRYDVRAVLIRTGTQRIYASTMFCLVGMNEDCQGL